MLDANTGEREVFPATMHGVRVEVIRREDLACWGPRSWSTLVGVFLRAKVRKKDGKLPVRYYDY